MPSFIRTLASLILIGVIVAAAFGLAAWKRGHKAAAEDAAKAQPEMAWAVEAAEVRTKPHARSTTTIGTVRALQSITLRNELPGTVHTVALQTGQIVEAGALLVELDVTVEKAELAAQEAESRLGETMLGRMEKALAKEGASAADVDRARAQRDMALANVERIKALIERKRVRAPFRAKVGMVDLHKGQYLDPGTTITTLQGTDASAHVDFAVPQDTAARLAVGGDVEITAAGQPAPIAAKIVAIDARVEQATRNTWIRALLTGEGPLPQPGASVRVRTPVEAKHDVMVVPISALRRSPGGEHVFVLANAPDGKLRAELRRVTAGSSLGDEVVIADGLKPGDRIATTGSFKLQPGFLVNVTNAADAKAAEAKPQ
jgi:membrane fusion protein (multidrug efflux system)